MRARTLRKEGVLHTETVPSDMTHPTWDRLPAPASL